MKTGNKNISDKKALRISLRILGTLCIVASCALLEVSRNMYSSSTSKARAVTTAGINTEANGEIAENKPVMNIRSFEAAGDSDSLQEEIGVAGFFLRNPLPKEEKSSCLLNVALRNNGKRCLLDFVSGSVMAKSEKIAGVESKASFSEPFGRSSGKGLELGAGEVVTLETRIQSSSVLECSNIAAVDIEVSCINAARLGA